MTREEIEARSADLKQTFEGLLARGHVAEAREAAELMAACSRELLSRLVLGAGGSPAMVAEAAVRLGLDRPKTH